MTYRVEDNHGCTDLPTTFEPTTRADKEMVGEILAWCTEQFGPRYGRRWYLYAGYFSFFDERDAFAFRLRWC
jgi:hypothetical protein